MIPKQREEARQGVFLPYRNRIIREYSSMGKNRSFICSHIDSFTGVKRPMTVLCPVQPYKKWDRDPVTKTKRAPIIIAYLIFFMKNTSHRVVYAVEKNLCGFDHFL